MLKLLFLKLIRYCENRLWKTNVARVENVQFLNIGGQVSINFILNSWLHESIIEKYQWTIKKDQNITKTKFKIEDTMWNFFKYYCRKNLTRIYWFGGNSFHRFRPSMHLPLHNFAAKLTFLFWWHKQITVGRQENPAPSRPHQRVFGRWRAWLQRPLYHLGTDLLSCKGASPEPPSDYSVHRSLRRRYWRWKKEIDWVGHIQCRWAASIPSHKSRGNLICVHITIQEETIKKDKMNTKERKRRCTIIKASVFLFSSNRFFCGIFISMLL